MTSAEKMREKIKVNSAKNKSKKLILTVKEDGWKFPDQDLSVEIRRDKKESKYQEAVYFNTITTTKNIAVDSTAGSGKTYTLVELSKLLPYGKRILFLAFNKSIVNELKTKLESTVECSTMHSLGCRTIFSHYRGEKSVNDKKAIKFIEPFCDKKIEDGKEVQRSPREKWAMIYEVNRILSMVRATMTPLDKEEIEKMCDEYGIDSSENIIKIVIKSLKKFYQYNDDSERGSISIDFQDMIEHCVRRKEIRMPQYDYVLIDEVQDLSKLDHLFIQRLVKPVTGRTFGFGDQRQSIYSFRGADIDSFNLFASRENTITLPLSVCYRCTVEIIEEARKIYPVIESWEGSEHGPKPRKGKVEEIREGDMVLCRNTRPLIEVFFELIERGLKAYVSGKDSEQGLLALLANFEGEEKTSECLPRLENILKNIEESLKAKGIMNPTLHPKYGMVEDKVNILRILFKRIIYIHEVEDFIKRVFDDEDRDGVALMTIHRSKGLENDRVFIIEKYSNKDLIPSSYATTKNQLKQEKNLRFVSVTRAKKELIYLHIG